jgi:probable blue pigment (indigoidine) exporter
MASARRRALVYVVLAAACWGTGTVLSKAAVAELPPLTLLGAQLLVSIGVLSIALWVTGQSIHRTDGRLVLLGALNPGLAYALSLIGLTMITASTSVLIWAMEPLLILLLAGLILAERPGPVIVALSAAAFAGLVAAVVTQLGTPALVGIALSLGGVICCVIYSVATRRWIAATPSTLAVVALQDVVAVVVVVLAVLAAAIGGSSPLPPALTLKGLSSAVASGVLYYGAAYLLYLTALRELPVSVAAMSFYLVPVFGIAAASVAGESLSSTQWIGATATIIAVVSAGFVDARRSAGPEVARIQPEEARCGD